MQELYILMTKAEYLEFRNRMHPYVRWRNGFSIDYTYPRVYDDMYDPSYKHIIVYNLYDRTIDHQTKDVSISRVNFITYKEFIEDYGCPII